MTIEHMTPADFEAVLDNDEPDSAHEERLRKANRPTFPHLENLERLLVTMPDFLSRPFTVSEKIHGWNGRVGRDETGELWIGTRNQDYLVADAETPPLQGFTEYVRNATWDLPKGMTVYGEWAGKGIQKGIDYGDKRFFIFAERMLDGPVYSTTLVIDQHWLLGHFVAPVIYEGSRMMLMELDELRRGRSQIAPGQPIEGIVISPVTPVFDVYGHQIIAKYKSPQFAELASARKERVAVDLTSVTAFAEEYVNEGRLVHVLDQVSESLNQGLAAGVRPHDPLDIVYTGDVLKTMYFDVLREGSADYDALSEADQKIVGKAVNKITLGLLAELRTQAAHDAVARASTEKA